MKLKLVALSMIFSICLFSFTGCGKKEPVNQDKNLKNVKVVMAKKSNIAIENEFAGEIKAYEEAGVVSKVPGKVKEILVNVGDRVKEGDILFTIDSEDIKAQLAQAEAGVEVAKANLQRTRSSGYSQPLIQAQMEFDQSRLSYEDANNDYSRFKALYESGAISKKDMDGITVKADLARQRYDTARKNLELLQNSSGPESIKISESQLSQAAASVQLLENQLRNHSVTAPISGYVSAKNINVGEAVSSAVPAVAISNMEVLNAEINIPEKLINKFKMGQKLSVNIQSLDSRTFDGEVSIISPAVDSATRNYKVKIRLLSKSEEVRPGMFAKIKLVVDKKDDVITIPSQAIFTESGVQYVYVVKDGKVNKTPVKIGLSNDRIVEITQGLSVDDNLIIEGQSFLSDGEAVNVL